MIDLENMRNEYRLKTLDEKSIAKDPFKQFTLWFEEAVQSQLRDPNACTLATCGNNGMPEARIVLLKRYDENGFVFFTNYVSKKANDIKDNPQVCLNFSWLELERQIRINGICQKISSKESLSYFLTRSRGSQLGAWVSEQSKVIESREILKMGLAKMKAKFANGEVPLPDFWGGYRLKPRSIEFWQGRESRLHDRLAFQKKGENWDLRRLAP